jgi:hypothetical protein
MVTRKCDEDEMTPASEFCQSDNVCQLVGAGIVPFARVINEDESVNIYFLLGLEQISDTQQTWDIFGGHISSDHTETPEEIASREFIEETAGLAYILNFDEELPHQNSDQLCEILSNNQYLMKVIHNDNENRRYVAFVTEIPFDPDLPTRFYEIRQHLIEIAKGTRNAVGDIAKHPAIIPECVRSGNPDMPKINWAYLEKKQLQWYSKETIIKALTKQNGVLQMSGTCIKRLRNEFQIVFKKIMEQCEF